MYGWVRNLLRSHNIYKKKIPLTLITYYIIRRQVLAMKRLPKEFAITIKMAIKIVKFIKSKALNTCIFKKVCDELDSEHDALLFHAEVR